MSITGPVPPETSIEAVEKIFQPKPKRSRNSNQDVIYTLSSAVERLDEHIAQKRGDQSSHTAEQKAALIKALTQRNETAVDPNRTHHLDGPPRGSNLTSGNVKLVIQEIQRQFRPFKVPPVPQPLSDAEIDAAEAKAAEAERQEEMQARTLEIEIEQQDYNDPYIQQIVINVPHDSTDSQEQGFFNSNGTAMMEIENPDVSSSVQEIDPSSLTFERRSSIIGRRRRMGNVSSRLRSMYAISVKRQRRLKMKKHKYKKLMRKNRVLRRKLGQI